AVGGCSGPPPGLAVFSPLSRASGPAVRWSILSGLLWSLSPAASLLGSLKAWRSLSLYVLVVLITRWTLPWVLSQVYEPLDGVARGNVVAAAFAGAFSIWLVWPATRREEAA